MPAAAVMTLIDVNPVRVRYGATFALADTIVTHNVLADLVPGPLRNIIAEAVTTDAEARAKYGLQILAADPEDHRVRTFMRVGVGGAGHGVPEVTGTNVGGRADLSLTPPGALAAATACSPHVITVEVIRENIGPGGQSVN